MALPVFLVASLAVLIPLTVLARRKNAREAGAGAIEERFDQEKLLRASLNLQRSAAQPAETIYL